MNPTASPSMHTSTLLRAICDASTVEERNRLFGQFAERFGPVILVWCKKYLSEDDARDVAQDVLLKLFDVDFLRAKFDPARGRFRPWFKTLVRHMVVDHFRRSARHSHLVAPMEHVQAADDLASSLDLHDLVQTAFERVKAELGEPAVEAYKQHALDEVPVEEIASRLGWSPAKVYRTMTQVKLALKAELNRLEAAR